MIQEEIISIFHGAHDEMERGDVLSTQKIEEMIREVRLSTSLKRLIDRSRQQVREALFEREKLRAETALRITIDQFPFQIPPQYAVTVSFYPETLLRHSLMSGNGLNIQEMAERISFEVAKKTEAGLVDYFRDKNR